MQGVNIEGRTFVRKTPHFAVNGATVDELPEIADHLGLRVTWIFEIPARVRG